MPCSSGELMGRLVKPDLDNALETLLEQATISAGCLLPCRYVEMEFGPTIFQNEIVLTSDNF